MSNKQLRLDPAQLTDVGRKRPHNEDNMAYVIPKDPQVMAKKGALFVVADGMGGHASGEVASEIAVDTVSNAYYQDDSDDVPGSLLRAIKRANALIHQRAAENIMRTGMGTTCVAAVLRGSTAYIANVGDSRAYFAHQGQVRQVSQDHSWVEEQVRAGLLSREQARSHAQRNVITRCLGTQVDVDVDVFSEPLAEGDVLVLCSDGLSGLISDEDIRLVIDQYQPQESVYHLVERANENGGPDNITAIVVRVVEVGPEPPGTRHPVYVGGREVVDEDTLTLGTYPNGAPMPMPGMPLQNGHSSPPPLLRYSSGPLSYDGMAPPAGAAKRQGRRTRLFYPILALLVLLIVSAAVGSLYYFFLRGENRVSVDKSLTDATASITQASNEVNNNPALALQHLASAKMSLTIAQSASLSAAQQTQVKNLQNRLVSTVKTAIVNYNTQSSITALPCDNTASAVINTGTTNTQAKSIAAIQDQKGTTIYTYALGGNGSLYQLKQDPNNQLSLLNPLQALGTSVQSIASDGSRLLALTKGTTAGSYNLHLLIPDQTGTLQDKNSSSINTNFTKNGNVPTFLTAWGPDVYVVLTPATDAQNNAFILKYSVNDKNNTLNPGTPSNTQISTTAGIAGVAAFPNQLFLLDGQGNLQSLMNGSQTFLQVVVAKPIALPLGVNAKDVVATTAVPQVTTQPSTFLRFPGATLVVAGDGFAAKSPLHLYVVDSTNHRVLDLMSTNATVVATVTPTSTSATPGIGVVGSTSAQVSMELSKQYTSSSLLTNVKSLVADPKQALLHILTQADANAADLSVISVDVSMTPPCAS